MIFELAGNQYNNEREIIDGGTCVIYWYCSEVKGRWRDIEYLMVENAWGGYWYARDVIKGRYEPELEILYLMRNSGSDCVKWYSRGLVRYGNV